MFYKRCLSRNYSGRVVPLFLRAFHTSVTSFSKKIPSQWDLATGVEKYQLVQYAKGNLNPFLMNPIKRGPGTKECPNVVLSFNSKTIIACHCHPDNPNYVHWWLHECYPRRCMCNYWFVLKRVEMPKLYED